MRILVFVLLSMPAAFGENLLQNGSFGTWRDGPVGWTVAKGAGAPEGKGSEVSPGADGGIALSGNAETRVWRIVTQAVATKPESVYRLSFEVRHAGLRREAEQFDNAYVGAITKGEAGRMLTVRAEDGPEGVWTPHELVFRAMAPQVEVAIFLSKTGTLEARGLVLEELASGDSFDVLIRNLGRYYSYLELKKIDWPATAAKHREAFAAAKDEAAFVSAVRGLLAELGDLHVTVRTSKGEVLPTWTADVKRNYDYKAVAAELKSPVQIGKVALAGTTADGFGFVAIGSLQFDDATLNRILAEIDARLDAPAFIVDLRGNAGGDERRAQAIAAIFADRERVYALSKVRAGPGPGDFSPPRERRIAPRAGKTFTKPVVCLIGPGCVSSGEGFVKMLKALPHVTLVGQPTRGASGNPAPLELPNGVTVTFSRWVDMLPDGTCIEGIGAEPQVAIVHEGAGDPTFRAGVAELMKRIK